MDELDIFKDEQRIYDSALARTDAMMNIKNSQGNTASCSNNFAAPLGLQTEPQ